MNKIFIRLDERTVQALVRLSRKEYRDPRAQAALIIQQDLERRGLLSEDRQEDKKECQGESK
jgi:hypothetical protein